MTSWFEIALLVGFSFLPPLIYTVWIRNTERCHREQWKPILMCFLWGASIAIIAALILEVLLEIPLALSIESTGAISLLTVIVVAPIAEEFTKPLALRMRSVKKELDELEDGLIYGAVAGLGFSATENLFYGWYFFSEGLIPFLILISLRSFGACLLHASATALTGYGYGKAVMKHASLLNVVPYFVLAIFVHGLYNFLVSFERIGAFAGLIVAFGFVLIAITLIRKKIRSLDGMNC